MRNCRPSPGGIEEVLMLAGPSAKGRKSWGVLWVRGRKAPPGAEPIGWEGAWRLPSRAWALAPVPRRKRPPWAWPWDSEEKDDRLGLLHAPTASPGAEG